MAKDKPTKAVTAENGVVAPAPAEKQPDRQPASRGMRPMKYRPIPHFKGGCGNC